MQNQDSPSSTGYGNNEAMPLSTSRQTTTRNQQIDESDSTFLALNECDPEQAIDQVLSPLRSSILSLAHQHGGRNVRYFISIVEGRMIPNFIVEFVQPNLIERIALQHDLQDLLELPVYVLNEAGIRPELKQHILNRAVSLESTD
ncbi:MAG: hypothetical protein K6T83_23225 [Alicyclobacillus sp.]|nr:hypothetical protein [Alicyclobacillus sp.]